jgi:hypothetical protein
MKQRDIYNSLKKIWSNGRMDDPGPAGGVGRKPVEIM